MSAPTQTVNFIPPSSFTDLSNQVNSFSGSLNVLNARSTVFNVSASFSATGNYTYQYALPARYAGSVVQVVCTLPAAPADGEFVELIDCPDPLRGWGNTIYSCRVVAQGSQTIQGDLAYFYPNTFGDLFVYRGMTIRLVFSAANNCWYGSSKGNMVSKTDQPFTGWWERINVFSALSGNANVVLSSYSYIDTSQYPIVYQEYEGTTKENFTKIVSLSSTFYQWTGATSSNPYASLLVTVANSSIVPGTGPQGAYAGVTPVTISFVGRSYDYISLIRSGASITNEDYARNTTPMGVYRRISAPTSAAVDRNLPSDFHQIDNVGGAFYNQSLVDPVFMFTKLFDNAEKYQGQMNNSITGNYAVDYYNRKQYFQDILSPQGVSFSVRF